MTFLRKTTIIIAFNKKQGVFKTRFYVLFDKKDFRANKNHMACQLIKEAQFYSSFIIGIFVQKQLFLQKLRMHSYISK